MKSLTEKKNEKMLSEKSLKKEPSSSKSSSSIKGDMKRLIQVIVQDQMNILYKERQEKDLLLLKQTIANDMLKFRNDFMNTQDQHSLQLAELKEKVSSLHDYMDNIHKFILEVQVTSKRECDNLKNEIRTSITEEREKRLILLKKVHKKHTEDIDLLNQALSTLRNDASQALLSVSDDIKALNKEVSRLRDNDIVVMRDQVDDLLIRRYGKVPTTSGNDYYGLENLTDKINQLDSRLEDDEVAEAEIEKMKLSRDKKITLVDIAKRHQKPSIDIDETITDLQVKINTLIDDMSSVKKTSIEALKKSRKNGNNETTGYDSDFEELVTKLQRKVKVISEQSTLGFAGLSSGLNEVQQTTIELYNFAEKVHKSFEVVSQKLNLGRNILPNITMPEFVITALNKN